MYIPNAKFIRQTPAPVSSFIVGTIAPEFCPKAANKAIRKDKIETRASASFNWLSEIKKSQMNELYFPNYEPHQRMSR